MLFILDRDGVINEESTEYVKSPKEWIPIPGSIEAMAILINLGHTVVVATNQSGIEKGLYSEEDLDFVHQHIQNQLSEFNVSIDKFYFCSHKEETQCDCRKPRTGMLEQIKLDYPALFPSAIFIGDSFRDIEAGKKNGM